MQEYGVSDFWCFRSLFCACSNGSIKDKSYLVEFTKKYAVDTLGLAKMSGIEKSTVSKMGLKGVPGIEIIPSTPRPAGSARR